MQMSTEDNNGSSSGQERVRRQVSVKEVYDNHLKSVGSMHKHRRIQQQREIDRQNKIIAKSILSVKPHISLPALESDFHTHLLTKANLSKFHRPLDASPKRSPHLPEVKHKG